MTNVLTDAAGDGANHQASPRSDGTGTDGSAALPPSSEGAAPAEAAPALRYLIAGLTASAGAIHLAMLPSHMGERAVEGVAFAVVGWLQLAVALLLVVRPSRLVLATAAVASLVFVAAWAVTRTAGPRSAPTPAPRTRPLSSTSPLPVSRRGPPCSGSWRSHVPPRRG